MAWVLTALAVADLDRISADGAIRFGYAQSEVYELELVGMLDTLAGMPLMAAERQAAQRAVRLMPCGTHNIIYVVESDDVIVLRVLHGLQNWFELL